MDINSCIETYLEMAPDIFPLEDAIKRLVKKHLGDKAVQGEDTLMNFEVQRSGQEPQCKV